MELRGLHLLVSYRCLYECDHCFVWGSPRQTGTMSVAQIREILQQGEELGTVEWIYFEGGEPFLYYPVLAGGVHLAKSRGFRVGVVSNAYWATDVHDALEWLEPFAGSLEDLSISCDLYHANENLSREASNAISAAEKLRIPVSHVSIAQPVDMNRGQIPADQDSLRYRGRAAEVLTTGARLHSWEQFTSCPHEELREPQRIHIDPFGYVHVCQGITMGNLFSQSLTKIVEEYRPEEHRVIGPLLEGGPAKLLDPELKKGKYADACHLCFSARKRLRKRFPEILAPKQMYGLEE